MNRTPGTSAFRACLAATGMALLAFPFAAEASTGIPLTRVGSGAASLGMGGNTVGLANDMSAAFANPGGLSFIRSREFHGGIEGLGSHVSTDFAGSTGGDVLRRFRFPSVGILYPFPTSQGGVAVTAQMHSPYIFDDVLVFEGTRSVAGEAVTTSRDYRIFGNLRYWTGGAGIQIAPGLSIGTALSLVTGGDNTRDIYYRLVDSRLVDTFDDTDQKFARTVVGYDLRFGLLYRLLDQFQLGVRAALPQRFRFEESLHETYPNQPAEGAYNALYRGKLYSSFSGAAGMAALLPFATFTTEGRVRLPYSFAYPGESIPSSSEANKYKIGAGAGIEVPVPRTGLRIRAGYSWDEYDPFSLVATYGNEPAGWNNPGSEVTTNRNLVTAGFGYLASRVLLDAAYGYQFYALQTARVLEEDHSFHRVAFSLSVRY